MVTRQRGQALPLGLAMILVGVLGALVLYNTGRTASDKARLANAADAAAYSGLLWQARALNFQAYTNRAMVANQVSIAQAVSISSWMRYGDQTAVNLSRVLGNVPFAAPLVRGAEATMSALDGLVQPVAGAMITVLDKVTRGLSASQEAMFRSSFYATPEIVRDVIAKSDAAGRFTALSAYGIGGLHENLSAWNDFTQRHDNNDPEAMDERALLVTGSRDEFTRKRDWKFFQGFWFYSSPIMRHRVFKSGSTNLIAVDGPNGRRWEWQGRDTLALQNRRLKWNGREKKQELPIGWGSAHANGTGGTSLLANECKRLLFNGMKNDDNLPCGTWGKNRGAERNALLDPEAHGGYEGLKAFRTINAALLANDGRGEHPTLLTEPVVRLKVEASLAAGDARSSADSIGGETFGIDVEAAGHGLSSISIAEVYYRRPAGASTSETIREAANGYNPYWDVRLSPVPDEERLVALGLRLGEGGTVSGGSGTIPGARQLSAGVRGEAGADAAEDTIGRYATLTLADLDDFTPDAVDVVADIRGVLTDELRQAPGAILGSLGGGRLERARNMLGGIETDDIEAVEEALREGSERFEAVAQVVADSLGRFVDELVRERVEAMEPDVARIGELAEQLESAVEGEKAALEEELERLTAVRDDALERLRDEIARHLITATEAHVPDWPLPLEVAYHTVDSFLADFEGRPDTDGIDVVEWVFSEEEDSEVDPDEGDDHGNY